MKQRNINSKYQKFMSADDHSRSFEEEGEGHEESERGDEP